jgi:hypothetical protein
MGSDRSTWLRKQLVAALRYDLRSVFHARWLAGIVFSLMPHFLRQKLNAAFRAISGTKENSNFVEDYG